MSNKLRDALRDFDEARFKDWLRETIRLLYSTEEGAYIADSYLRSKLGNAIYLYLNYDSPEAAVDDLLNPNIIDIDENGNFVTVYAVDDQQYLDALRGIETLILNQDIYDDVYDAIDHNNTLRTVYLDAAYAFDSYAEEGGDTFTRDIHDMEGFVIDEEDYGGVEYWRYKGTSSRF